MTIFTALITAYIGPGMGGGIIATILGVLASLFLAIVAVVWYPVKRMLRRRKQAGEAPEQPEATTATSRGSDT